MKAVHTVKRYIKKLRQPSITDDLTPHEDLLEKITTAIESLRHVADSTLRADMQRVRTDGSTWPENERMVFVYARVAEAFRRVLKLTPYKVQITAAIALHGPNIIEMQTGEGKTLVAVFAAALHALGGKGVHILTFNDYLARRDAEWMGPVYQFLGFSVGYTQEGMPPHIKRQAYACDVTYATAKETGFDYLRACMAYSPDEIFMRDFHCAIVDEADAVLIDEARNPLVFAGNLDEHHIDLSHIANLVKHLALYRDYMHDEYARNVYLTDHGIALTEQALAIHNLYAEENENILIAVNLALQAKTMLHRDVDYIIEEGRIKLVDEFTGRIVEDRKWQNGLQSAVEAKEGLTIMTEGRILNSITLQHLMGYYPKLAGMTGTARHAAEEFATVYGLGVTVIPSNRPVLRIDYPDKVYTHKAAKLNAIIDEIKRVHNTGRPVLIGTLTIRESEDLAQAVRQQGIVCTVLNARNNAQEAAIIENAGRKGAVTISTNMAGRGTDIVLGGKDQIDRHDIITAGGLHIIGTNRHESIRIDNQLKGRAGRQGDPGSSQFIVSMEDDLMVRYGLNGLLPVRYRNLRQEHAVDSPTVARSIAQAQRIIEGQLYEIRLTLNRYAYFVEQQRNIIFNRRREILAGEVPHKEYLLYIHDSLWSHYLAAIAGLREGIYWHRMAGLNPIQEFYKAADELFQRLSADLDAKTATATLNPAELQTRRPSSTWTYLVNDNPFKSSLGMMFLANANIGYQVDMLAMPVLMVMRLWKRVFGKTV